MGIDLGFGDLIDRVEKHIGSKATKALIFAAWMLAMAFCVNGIFGYLVSPIIHNGTVLRRALSLSDYARIALTIVIGIASASSFIEAYRMGLLRRELEDTTGGAHELLEDIRAFRQSSRAQTAEDLAATKQILAEASIAISRVHGIHQTAQMMAEDIYKFGVESDAFDDATLSQLRDLIKLYGAAGESMAKADELIAPYRSKITF